MAAGTGVPGGEESVMDADKSKVALGGLGSGSGSGLHPVLAYDPEGSMERTESERGGFSGTCETTLTDWIQLVQMGRRDAVVSLRTHDGKEATLWCRQGDIIDAACDGLAGEDAVYRALSWQSGRVSVDFGAFKHMRAIQITTAGLLLGAALRKDSPISEPGYEESPPSSPTPPPASAADTRTVTLQSPYPAWLKRRRPTAMLLAVTGGLLALVLLFGLVSTWRFPAGSPGTTLATSTPEFLVSMEVDPANAAILLDGKQVGVGRFNQSLPRDGRVHEIVCSAPGYRSERRVFYDAPPAQHVILLRRGGGAVAVVDGQFPPTAAEVQVQAPAVWPADVKSTSTRHRVATTQGKQSRTTSSNVASRSGSEMRRESEPHKGNVQTIEERRPRVQIIGERKPSVEMIH